jgi:hypothetical protein
MKIFGKKFVTKKQLKEKVAALEAANTGMLEAFPFKLGQVVYDLQLKNESGRYTKKNASMEHSVINEVVVSEKNYFSLVTRYRKHDVFMTYADADSYLTSVCK